MPAAAQIATSVGESGERPSGTRAAEAGGTGAGETNRAGVIGSAGCWWTTDCGFDASADGCGGRAAGCGGGLATGAPARGGSTGAAAAFGEHLGHSLYDGGTSPPHFGQIHVNIR
jgi:hypothetical protein